ncbi:unnamed protein product [Mesocestoides corti]|uniref:Secreted protein n=1 Tax=Mesocestoides corti TaxID=53468 RepID=A0A0R3UPD9_MESCO|nr:unnamed protein product [Mesocestoides corti]
MAVQLSWFHADSGGGRNAMRWIRLHHVTNSSSSLVAMWFRPTTQTPGSTGWMTLVDAIRVSRKHGARAFTNSELERQSHRRNENRNTD